MKTLILTILLLASIFQRETDVKVEYDKFEDRTGVTLFGVSLAKGEIGWLPSPSGANDPPELRLTLIDTYKGKTPTTKHSDEGPLVSLSSTQSLSPLSSPPALILLIDGERITVGAEWFDPLKRKDHKEVRIRLTYDLLSRISKANKAEGKLGTTEFHFQARLKEEIQTFMTAAGVTN